MEKRRRRGSMSSVVERIAVRVWMVRWGDVEVLMVSVYKNGVSE